MKIRIFGMRWFVGVVMMCAAVSTWAFEMGSASRLFVVGSALSTGWDRWSAPEMSQPVPGVFSWKGTMQTGDFKFIIGRDTWAAVVSPSLNPPMVLNTPLAAVTCDEGADGDFKWIITEPGVYGLTVDIVAGTLTISNFPTITTEAKALTQTSASTFELDEELDAGRFVIRAVDAVGNQRWIVRSATGAYTYTADEYRATVQVVGQRESTHIVVDTAAMTQKHLSGESGLAEGQLVDAQVYTRSGRLVVDASREVEIEVFNLAGILEYSARVMHSDFELPAGVYIVVVDGLKAIKIAICR